MKYARNWPARGLERTTYCRSTLYRTGFLNFQYNIILKLRKYKLNSVTFFSRSFKRDFLNNSILVLWEFSNILTVVNISKKSKWFNKNSKLGPLLLCKACLFPCWGMGSLAAMRKCFCLFCLSICTKCNLYCR